MKKIVSIILLMAFSLNTLSYGLATLPASQNPIAKRKILATLRNTQIRYAESEDAKKLLKDNNASSLLLSSGKYLVSEEVYEKYLNGNYIAFLSELRHKDFEALMQILAKYDRYKYRAIKELILKHFPPTKDNKLPMNLYVNHTIAKAFQWLSMVKEEIIFKSKIPDEERGFINAIEKIIKGSNHYFSFSIGSDYCNFWDPVARRKTIRKARNEGMRFYQVAGAIQQPRKCLVLDCDGVLWDGIVGEDGIDGIRITPAHIEFQKRVKTLREQGVILAINSKNNPGDVEAILEKHPDMVLRRSDFAAMRVNWQDKATNMGEIAEELNIGIDSFVFLDDSPHERHLVRMTHPEVLTPDLPDNPEETTKLIDGLGVFNQQPATEEDKRRTELYETKEKRDRLRDNAPSMEDFYRSLDMKVIVREGAENLPYVRRIAQLTQRTNQFNLTGNKYNEQLVESFIGSSDYRVYSLELIDKFGSDGIVGVIIVREEHVLAGIGKRLAVDTFCLSCRAIGRTIERAFFACVVNNLKEKGEKSLRGRYIDNGRNSIVENIYAELLKSDGGWNKETRSKEYYNRLSEINIDVPEWIEILPVKLEEETRLVYEKEKLPDDVTELTRICLERARHIGLNTERLEQAIAEISNKCRNKKDLRDVLKLEIKLLGRAIWREVTYEGGNLQTKKAYCDEVIDLISKLEASGFEVFYQREIWHDKWASGISADTLYKVGYAKKGSVKRLSTDYAVPIFRKIEKATDDYNEFMLWIRRINNLPVETLNTFMPVPHLTSNGVFLASSSIWKVIDVCRFTSEKEWQALVEETREGKNVSWSDLEDRFLKNHLKSVFTNGLLQSFHALESFTLKEFQEKTGVTVSTARKKFDILEELGLVEIERPGRGKPNKIRYVVPAEILRTSFEKILRSYRNKNDIPRLKTQLAFKLYDTESATALISDLIYTQLHEDKTYEIKYDTSRLSPSQIAIIETYISLLQKRTSNPNNIKARPFSSERGSKESLIAVYCTGKDFKGEGHVDIDITEGNIEEYLLRITGMVNIALAASNIPTNATEEDLKTTYGSIIGFIKRQHKDMLGIELYISGSLENMLKTIRFIILSLPKIYRIPANKIEEYNRLAKKALIAA